jgi:hypothetical protein
MSIPGSETIALRINVYANNGRLRPEIIPPHPQRTPIEYTDLYHGQRLAPKAGKVTMVDIKVVTPPIHYPAIAVTL